MEETTLEGATQFRLNAPSGIWNLTVVEVELVMVTSLKTTPLSPTTCTLPLFHPWKLEVWHMSFQVHWGPMMTVCENGSPEMSLLKAAIEYS